MSESNDELTEAVRASLQQQAARILVADQPFDPDHTAAHRLSDAPEPAHRGDRGRALVAVAAGVILILAIGAVAFVGQGGEDADVQAVSPPETSRPEPLRARLELSATTVQAGDFIDGVVILNNETGRAFEVDGCGGLYAAGLGSDTIQPSIVRTMCLGPIPIPEGESRHPVRIGTTYESCITAEDREYASTYVDPATAQAILAQQDCVVDPNSPPPPGEPTAYVPPPLPPGQYRVVVGGTPGVPTPDPVEVTLT